tara:strand:- start:58 stop:567 length:510 start_codon:yes stop_codon:yes gene_type:complete
MPLSLNELEKNASDVGLLLRIQIRRPFKLWAIKLVVAEKIHDQKIQIWGEMKAWAYSGINGLQLDTMRVNPSAPNGVGHLIWAGTMAWALQETPCKKARLLAIRDEDKKHKILVRYFINHGFKAVRDIGSSPADLPLRMIWGGSGLLMNGNCSDILSISEENWRLKISS